MVHECYAAAMLQQRPDDVVKVQLHNTLPGTISTRGS